MWVQGTWALESFDPFADADEHQSHTDEKPSTDLVLEVGVDHANLHATA
jgi:hypothetical protein